MRQFFNILILIIFINTIFNYDLVLKISQNTLLLFFDILFPSLFLTSFLLYYLYELNFFFTLRTKTLAKLFNMNQDAFNFTLILVLLGYPFASSLIDQAYQNKSLKQLEANRLFYCIHISKISFIITYVGNTLFHNLKLSLLCYLIQLFSVIILLLLTNKQPINYQHQQTKPSLFNSLNHALSTSFKQILMIAGYLMLILCLSSLFKQVVSNFIIIDYLLELTYAITCLAKANLHISLTFIITQILLTFAGLSIHLQILSLVKHLQLNYLTFLKYRLLQSIIIIIITSMIITIYQIIN